MTSVPPPFQHPGPPPPRPEVPEGVYRPSPAGGSGLAAVPRLGVPAWAPFAALLGTFVAVVIVAIVVGVAVAAAGGEFESDSTTLNLALTVVQAGVMVGAAWYTVQLLSRRPTPAAFGLRGTPILPAIGWTLLAYFGFWIIAAIVLLALGEPEDQQLVEEIQNEDTFAVLAGYAVLSCFLAPVAEEFFFRGFMFRALAERVHAIWAAVITGGVFGVIHLPGSPAESVVVLSVFGVALCVVFWRTGSLIPCIMLHAFNNAISFGATKGLPWWGFLMLVVGSVGMTLLVSLLVVRLARRAPPAPA